MHPIERLRYVARSSGAPQQLLVAETAAALASFRNDPSALVTACRRIVSRQLASGPLWWLCARMLTAPDPLAEARAAVAEIDDDPTPRLLASGLPDDAVVVTLGWQPQSADAFARRGDLEVIVVDVFGEAMSFVHHLGQRDVMARDVALSGLAAVVCAADVVVLEATAFGPSGILGVAGSHAAAAVAAHAGVPVWAVVGVGRVLPTRVWEALLGRLDALGEPWDLDDEVVPIDLINSVVGPAGLESPASTLLRTDCPIAPELFKPDIT